MIDPLTILGVIVVLACLGGIVFTSLSEAALLGVSEVGKRRLGESRDPRAHMVIQLLANSDYLSALIVGMNTFIIVISTVVTLLVHHNLEHGSDLLREGVHVGMILIILIFAELTPKTYGGLYPDQVALRVAPSVRLLSVAFRPLVLVLARISQPLVALSGHGSHGAQFMTMDEIRAAADVSEEEGLVDAEEAEMLDSVMDLGHTMVREIMAPRVDMVTVEETATVPEFTVIASRSGYSRIPLYSETLDNITGIAYVTDVLTKLGAGDTNFELKEIARTPLYVPETKRIHELLRELRDKRVHIAIVVDEFGGTAGIATIEDILEELVGEIEDEHDPPNDEIVRVNGSELIVDGKTRIDEVNDLLHTELPEDDYETIGGLISGLAGHIPASGEAFEMDRVRLVVEESDGQHVERVRIVALNREGGEA